MSSKTFSLATWNVNSLRVRLPQVLTWLQQQQPDMLVLQETKVTDDAFPADEIAQVGYQSIFSGQKTYNGVAILSREQAEDPITDLPGLDDPQRRVLGATLGKVRILNLYVPNGQSIDSEKYYYKLEWLAKLADYVKAQLRKYDHFVMLGDFNIAPTDLDVYDPQSWQDQVLVSPPERNALDKIIQLGLVDLLRQYHPEQIFTWWDYRQGAFRRNRGLRIDHIIASAQLADCAIDCRVDIEARKVPRPSDHAPVVAKFDLT